MTLYHRTLTPTRWAKLSLFEQLANVGSEVERSILWKNKDNLEYSRLAFFRGLELLDLTLGTTKSGARLKELARLRETLVDYFFGSNQYRSSDRLWRDYFSAFHYAACKDR